MLVSTKYLWKITLSYELRVCITDVKFHLKQKHRTTVPALTFKDSSCWHSANCKSSRHSLRSRGDLCIRQLVMSVFPCMYRGHVNVFTSNDTAGEEQRHPLLWQLWSLHAEDYDAGYINYIVWIMLRDISVECWGSCWVIYVESWGSFCGDHVAWTLLREINCKPRIMLRGSCGLDHVAWIMLHGTRQLEWWYNAID